MYTVKVLGSDSVDAKVEVIWNRDYACRAFLSTLAFGDGKRRRSRHESALKCGDRLIWQLAGSQITPTNAYKTDRVTAGEIGRDRLMSQNRFPRSALFGAVCVNLST